jgi:hypothetical protein
VSKARKGKQESGSREKKRKAVVTLVKVENAPETESPSDVAKKRKVPCEVAVHLPAAVTMDEGNDQGHDCEEGNVVDDKMGTKTEGDGGMHTKESMGEWVCLRSNGDLEIQHLPPVDQCDQQQVGIIPRLERLPQHSALDIGAFRVVDAKAPKNPIKKGQSFWRYDSDNGHFMGTVHNVNFEDEGRHEVKYTTSFQEISNTQDLLVLLANGSSRHEAKALYSSFERLCCCCLKADVPGAEKAHAVYLRCEECNNYFHKTCVVGAPPASVEGENKGDWYCPKCVVGWRDSLILTAKDVRERILAESVLNILFKDPLAKEVGRQISACTKLTGALKAFFFTIPARRPMRNAETRLCFGISNSLSVGTFRAIANRCHEKRLASLESENPSEEHLELEQMYWDLLSNTTISDVVVERSIVHSPTPSLETCQESKVYENSDDMLISAKHASRASDTCVPMDMHSLLLKKGSILRGLEAKENRSEIVLGVALTSVFWNIDPQEMSMLRYLHEGTMTWYAVPEKDKAAFKALSLSQEGQLHPCTVLNHGISVTKVEQQANEFVVVFPGVYHFGFGHAFTCLESSKFATFEWASSGRNVAVAARHWKECTGLHAPVFPFSIETLFLRKCLRILRQQGHAQDKKESEVRSMASCILPPLQAALCDLESSLSQLLLQPYSMKGDVEHRGEGLLSKEENIETSDIQKLIEISLTMTSLRKFISSHEQAIEADSEVHWSSSTEVDYLQVKSESILVCFQYLLRTDFNHAMPLIDMLLDSLPTGGEQLDLGRAVLFFLLAALWHRVLGLLPPENKKSQYQYQHRTNIRCRR